MHGRRTAPARLRLVRQAMNPWYEVTITEGRQNQIRIMFKHFGFLVEKLKRTKIGFLELAYLKPGSYRTLTRQEVARFQRFLSWKRARAQMRAPRRAGLASPKRLKKRMTDEALRNFLASAKTIAVVGLIQQSDSAKLRSLGIYAVPWLQDHTRKPERN